MRSLLADGEVAFVRATRKIVSLSDLPPRQIGFMMMAYGEAAKSPLHNQHGAVIVKNGEVIAKGHNRIPCFTQKASYTRHAEEVALRSCPPHQLRDADLYVVRKGRVEDGYPDIQISKPCQACSRLIKAYIKKYGLRHTYFSINTLIDVDSHALPILRTINVEEKRPSITPIRRIARFLCSRTAKDEPKSFTLIK
eukprot:jgi/Bigna1/132831/aug1.19_g7539